MFEWIKTIIILPMNVLVFIPFLVLYFTKYTFTKPDIWQIVVGCTLLIFGLSLAFWTMRLFATKGQGTAAPWNPPKNLVVEGPYRHVRNPMITSVLVMLISEAILLSSYVILALFVIFWLLNTIYFPLFEEKDLEKRFGDDYLKYKKNVPAWIPRITPWSLD